MSTVANDTNVKKLIDDGVDFSLINLYIKMGTLNESYVIDEIVSKEELNNYIYDAILYLQSYNKERLLKNMDKVLNNYLALRLFIANLSKKGLPLGIGTNELEIIGNKIITTNDSLNIYIYAEFIKDCNINNDAKYKIISLLTKGIGGTSIYYHQEEYIRKIINQMNINENDKLYLKNVIVDEILNSNNLSLISEFLYVFNRDETEIYKNIDKYKVYNKIVEIALLDDNQRAMVNLSYLDFTNDNINVLGKLILDSQNLFFIYCFARKFVLFNEELQAQYVDYLTLHVNDYEELKENLETFLKNHRDNRRIFKKY